MSCDTNALEAIANDDYEELCYIEIAMRYEGGMGTPDCGISTEVGQKVLNYLKKKRIAMSEERQAIYSAKRAVDTAANLRTTEKRGRPPKPKAPEPEVVERLKHQAESIEGSEAVETIITSGGDQPIAPRLEDLVEGKTPSFQGA